MQLFRKINTVNMITCEMIRLFITISMFCVVITKGYYQDCYLRSDNKTASPKMPIVFTLVHDQANLVYPDRGEVLRIRKNTLVVLSCTSTNFSLNSLNSVNEIITKCVGGNQLFYLGKLYNYTDFICMHVPRSVLQITDKVCQPNNSTVIDVGFKTKDHFFPLYHACFDRINKNTFYTWYNLRLPFFKHHQHRPRLRVFTVTEELYDDIDIGLMYAKYMQKETINKILRMPLYSDKYVSKTNQFLTRGHYAPKTDFYYSREQAATFNYVNVAPQWLKFNHLWTEVEKAIKKDMVKNSFSRRVIVTGAYGKCMLPDVDDNLKHLYLVMPQKQVLVPLFLWKLIYDADDSRNDVVYIGVNNPFADIDTVNKHKLRCVRIRCPGNIYGFDRRMIYCCTKDSFLRSYGWINEDEVLKVPKVNPFEKFRLEAEARYSSKK